MLTTESTHSFIKCTASLLKTELLSHKLTKQINTGQYPSKLLQALTWVQGAQLLSFNRTQSRAVIGLLTGHNTLRRYLYVMSLSNNPICRKCGTVKETSVHILCASEALASTHISGFLRILGN